MHARIVYVIVFFHYFIVNLTIAKNINFNHMTESTTQPNCKDWIGLDQGWRKNKNFGRSNNLEVIFYDITAKKVFSLCFFFFNRKFDYCTT